MTPSQNIRRAVDPRPLIDLTGAPESDIQSLERIAHNADDRGDSVSADLLDQVICRMESEIEFQQRRMI